MALRAGIDPKLIGMTEQPLQTGIAILDRRGKRMFRRQSIIDRYRHAIDSLDHLFHEAVVLLDVSHHVSAAVNPQQRGKLARLHIRPVNAHPDIGIAFAALDHG